MCSGDLRMTRKIIYLPPFGPLRKRGRTRSLNTHIARTEQDGNAG